MARTRIEHFKCCLGLGLFQPQSHPTTLWRWVMFVHLTNYGNTHTPTLGIDFERAILALIVTFQTCFSHLVPFAFTPITCLWLFESNILKSSGRHQGLPRSTILLLRRVSERVPHRITRRSPLTRQLHDLGLTAS